MYSFDFRTNAAPQTSEAVQPDDTGNAAEKTGRTHYPRVGLSPSVDPSHLHFFLCTYVHILRRQSTNKAVVGWRKESTIVTLSHTRKKKKRVLHQLIARVIKTLGCLLRCATIVHLSEVTRRKKNTHTLKKSCLAMNGIHLLIVTFS